MPEIPAQWVWNNRGQRDTSAHSLPGRKGCSTMQRCLTSQGDMLSFLPPLNCETSSASNLNNEGKCSNAIVTCNLFYVHSTVGSSHQRSKKQYRGRYLKEPTSVFPPCCVLLCCYFLKVQLFLQVSKVQAELFWKSNATYFTYVLFLILSLCSRTLCRKAGLELPARHVCVCISYTAPSI